jgi:hypothetical protein
VILHQDGPSEPFLYQHFRYFSGITCSRTKSFSNTAEILPFNSRTYCTRAYSARNAADRKRDTTEQTGGAVLPFKFPLVRRKLSLLLYCQVPVPIGFQLTHALTRGAQPRRRTVLGRELESGANNI